MSSKRKRLTINLVPTPAERWAEEQRVKAKRDAIFEQMIKDVLDG